MGKLMEWLLKEKVWLVALVTAAVAFAEASGHPLSPTVLTLLASLGVVYSRGPQTTNMNQQSADLKQHISEEVNSAISAILRK